MNRVFDPIDIVFIVLISLYLFLLAVTLIIWFKTKSKPVMPVRYKVVKIIHPKKKTRTTSKRKTTKKKAGSKNKSSKTT